MLILHLIRHGETAANKCRILQGNSESDLTQLDDDGIKTTLLAKQTLSHFPNTVCFVSPLNRAQMTARLLFESSKVKMITDERLTEIDYGTWNGQSIQTLVTTYPQYWDAQSGDVRGTYEIVTSGEPIIHVQQRVLEFLESLVQTFDDDQQITIVTHGYIIQTIQRMLGVEPISIIKNLQSIQVNLDASRLQHMKKATAASEN